MKYISLFAGIGGFDLALNRLGHECVYANDFDKYCKITYDKNFKTSNEMELGRFGQEENKLEAFSSDSFCKSNQRQSTNSEIYRGELDTTSITEVDAKDIPDHDLLVGGFPCQAFSIAGKRRGFDDTRGTLFFDVARILKEKQPRLFILENVKGLLSHDAGRTFKTIIATLVELGYDLQWQVLNSKNFGVPQNRERVFIIGHLRGTSRPKVFPFRDSNPKYLKEITKGASQGYRTYKTDGISTTLASQAGGLGAKTGLYAIDMTRREQTGYRLRKDKRASTLDANYYREIANQERPGVLDDMKIRRLTPIECERLQGFPDNWTEGVSDTQRYKQLGNAVTVNVVYEVAKRL